MLTVSLLGRRVARPSCISHNAYARTFSAGAKCFAESAGGDRGARRKESKQDEKKDNGVKKSSLVEQLFPEETKRYEEERERPQREVPRLPLEDVQINKPIPSRSVFTGPDGQMTKSSRLRKNMEEWNRGAENETSVLVLLNASKNLMEEDFRRLIPQGRHMEGWTLEQGSILKVIPGRNLDNLEQTNEYYLLFASPLSAFVYQGQASRISRLVTEQTPNALHNSIPPPPGYLIDGIDAYAAMQAYALTAPTQKLQLRQLRPPLAPMVAHLVRNGGYAAITKRPDKMPFEARLTLEGPQLPIAQIRHIMYESGRDRGLAWSGGENMMLKISQWEQKPKIAPQRRDNGAIGQAQDPQPDDPEAEESDGLRNKFGDDEGLPIHRHRTPQPVYVVGFHTELAAQAFVRYWNRRVMEWGEGTSEVEGDTAPIANVEMLW